MKIPIFMYHSIGDCKAGAFGRFTVSATALEVQIRWLEENGYRTVTVSDLMQARDGRARLPEKPVVLTFDDGFADFYEEALPILVRNGVTATLYVVSGTIGRTSHWLSGMGEGHRRMATWAELDEIRRAGVEIGGHSVTHAALDLMPLDDARREIAVCKRVLEDGLGCPVLSFAYPFGYQNAELRRIVREENYIGACAVRYAMSSQSDERFALARHLVRDDWDGAVLRTVLQGKAPLLSNFYDQTEIASLESRPPLRPEPVPMSVRSISVIICVYDQERWQHILEAVASVRAQQLPPRELIIVVDYNEELRDRLRASLGDVRIIDNRYERGLSGARNTGIAEARGELVAFLDDDAVAGRNWLARMAVHFDRPEVAGVTSRSDPEWLGTRPSWFPDEYSWAVGCSHSDLPDTCVPVRNVFGGAMCCRREVLRRAGGFSTSLGRESSRAALELRGYGALPEDRPIGRRAVFLHEPAASIQHKIPAQRLSSRYFFRRCYAEGLSKAYLGQILSRLAGPWRRNATMSRGPSRSVY